MAAINHHSVPNFYLKKFKDSSLPEYKIWQYEKERKPKLVPSVRATVIEHYNTVLLSATGSFDSDIVEAALSRYETDAAVLFSRIESADFDSRDKEAFAKWMSIQMTRVPCFRDWILEGVRREYQVAVSPSYALAHVEDAYYTSILDLEWGFLEASSGSHFVTSDNPVHLCSAGLVYPLNPNLALVAGEQGAEGLTQADPELIDIVNLKTVEGAYKYVYASENLANLDAKVQQSLGIYSLAALRGK
jgi:hypothetical protein